MRDGCYSTADAFGKPTPDNSRRHWEIMISYKHFYGLAFTAFLFGLTLIAGGVTLTILTDRHGSEFQTPGLVSCLLGTLATWSGGTNRRFTERLDKIEADVRVKQHG
jgi:hypothetical protein